MPNPLLVTITNLNEEQLFEIYKFINKSKIKARLVEIVDMSDSSGNCDLLYEYLFETTEDAVIFKLRFGRHNN